MSNVDIYDYQIQSATITELNEWYNKEKKLAESIFTKYRTIHRDNADRIYREIEYRNSRRINI